MISWPQSPSAHHYIHNFSNLFFFLSLLNTFLNNMVKLQVLSFHCNYHTLMLIVHQEFGTYSTPEGDSKECKSMTFHMLLQWLFRFFCFLLRSRDEYTVGPNNGLWGKVLKQILTVCWVDQWWQMAVILGYDGAIKCIIRPAQKISCWNNLIDLHLFPWLIQQKIFHLTIVTVSSGIWDLYCMTYSKIWYCKPDNCAFVDFWIITWIFTHGNSSVGSPL